MISKLLVWNFYNQPREDSHKMEPTGKILFFGDCSLPIMTALSQLLRSQQTNTLLSQFLSSCQDVLHGEVKHLPPRVRHDALSFTSFFDFLDPRNQASRSLKVLSPALLVLVQLGNCISLVNSPIPADPRMY